MVDRLQWYDAGVVAPIRHHPIIPFVFLEAAVVASGAGNGIAAVAIPWLILERTGSAAAAGLVGAATALPLLLSALFSGAVVDTLGQRRTSMLSDVLSAVSVAAIPVADLVFGLDLGLIVVLVVVGALFDPAGATAREAMLPSVTARARVPLERGNGIHEAAWGVAFMVGPGLGGLLIALVGAAGALWVTSFAFLLSIAAIALVKAPRIGRPTEEERPTSILRGSLDGLSFVWKSRVLRALVLLEMVLVAVYMPIEGVVLPVFFEDQQAPGRLGLVLMALSAGAVAGSLLYSAVARRLRRFLLYVSALVLASFSVLAMSLLPAYPLLVAAGALAGFFSGPLGPLLNFQMQTTTPPSMRGRVLGVMMATTYAAGPAGYLVAGWLIQRFGVEPVFLGMGVLMAIVAVAGSFIPSLRGLDEEGPYEAELSAPEIRPPAELR
jgi:MFS family permease